MFILYFIDVYWSVVAAVQKSEPVTHTPISPLFRFPSHLGLTGRCVGLPKLSIGSR